MELEEVMVPSSLRELEKILSHHKHSDFTTYQFWQMLKLSY